MRKYAHLLIYIFSPYVNEKVYMRMCMRWSVAFAGKQEGAGGHPDAEAQQPEWVVQNDGRLHVVEEQGAWRVGRVGVVGG